jgi:opacity protein-like surface antigen
MKIVRCALLASAAIIGLVSTASAADLPIYSKAPVAPVPVYSWTGFYGGVYGGGGFSNNPVTGIGTMSDPAYNNLANGGIGQVSNLINPGGVNCAGLVNCNVGGAATTSITPNYNPGFQTSSSPTSQNSSQMAGLIGVELGYRQQFNHFVLGIGTDISAFSHGSSTNYGSQGSFFNTNGFTANSQAIGCIVGAGVTCTQAQLLNTSGSVMTVNSGASTTNLAIASNPNWIGTVRASAGYAFDRLLIFGSGGLAYSDGGLKVSGSYHDTVTSACSGVSNVVTAAGGTATPGNSFVNYSCGGTPLNSASVNQVTTTSVAYSGAHGGILTGFAVGSGAAYAITDHISLEIEGLYYNLGTVRTTTTGSGSQTTATTNTGTIPGGGVTQVTTTAALTSSPFTVSKMIDGFIFKGGVQFKF